MGNVCEIIARFALQAMLYEVSAAPKPGLVDRFNSGAHKDMDIFTFMSSSASLSSYFIKCAAKGLEYTDGRPEELMAALRGIGMDAEKVMFGATEGKNTHKGLIFSLGIICAAAASCIREQECVSLDAGSVCRKAAGMTAGICSRELDGMRKTKELTNGEKLYKKYGFKGIRGEAESGFATVRTYSLPVLSKLKSMKRYHVNDILVQTLLHLMAVNEDTNIAARHDRETLDYVKKYAAEVLEAGGMLTPEGTRMVYEMDREFIKRNISPGGSADLLAVTIMLDLLCGFDS